MFLPHRMAEWRRVSQQVHLSCWGWSSDRIAQECPPVFKPGKRGRKMMPVKYQIMIWLHFFGHEGMTLKQQREILHTCTDLCQSERDRVTKAFITSEMIGFTGPTLMKEKEFPSELKKNTSCPIVWDWWMVLCSGWLLSLVALVRLIFITCDVICDDKLIIRDYLAGFPGSTHDGRIWRHQVIYIHPTLYFSSNEYVVTDTAFEPTWFCIPVYICIGGNHLLLPPDKTEFNFCLTCSGISPSLVQEYEVSM